jgi:hypothetical protein
MNLSGIRLGNGIARQYKNAKLRRRFYVIQSGLSTTATAMAAKEGTYAGVGIFTAATALFLSMAKKCHKTMKSLEPAYQEIVQRANKIFKK